MTTSGKNIQLPDEVTAAITSAGLTNLNITDAVIYEGPDTDSLELRVGADLDTSVMASDRFSGSCRGFHIADLSVDGGAMVTIRLTPSDVIIDDAHIGWSAADLSRIIGNSFVSVGGTELDHWQPSLVAIIDAAARYHSDHGIAESFFWVGSDSCIASVVELIRSGVPPQWALLNTIQEWAR